MAGDQREVSTSGLVDTKQAGARRRRWPEAVKRELVAATFAPGASVSTVARRHDVNANQLFKWRRQFRDGAPPAAEAEPARLLPVTIAASPGPAAVVDGAAARSTAVPMAGSIEIALPGGVRIRIKGEVEPAAVRAAVGAVLSTRRRR